MSHRAPEALPRRARGQPGRARSHRRPREERGAPGGGARACGAATRCGHRARIRVPRAGTFRDSGLTMQHTFIEILRRALDEELARDATVHLLGEDVTAGGAFRVTPGL